MIPRPCDPGTSSGISSTFAKGLRPLLFPSSGYVTHALLTLPPLTAILLLRSVRLACLSHAASVQAEPGSNSSIEFLGTSHASRTALCRDLRFCEMCWSSKRVCSYASQSENRPASVPRPAKARKQARLKHLHVGLDPRQKIDENPLKKMIKDHFIACTTKMLEILANQSPRNRDNPG